ncbi:hypothetical protein JHK86_051302 [Glycine max]|nr:hypothetical protein JHK86_051302 [Glycine max]
MKTISSSLEGMSQQGPPRWIEPKIIETDSDGGLLKLTRTQEWLTGDNSPPINKKVTAKLKRELLLLSVGIGLACSGYCLVIFSVQAAISYAIGVLFRFVIALYYIDTVFSDLERSVCRMVHRQKKLMLKAKSILEETITTLYRDSSPNCMKVADLGCSVGPNTFLVTSNIIDIVDNTITLLNCEQPTFQFYLNDLYGNDFNTIFKSLPDFYTRLEEDKGHKFGSCFINATPGSFHGRLFPSNSINFFHSANSLHWLSQDPLSGLTEEEKSLNKGNCHLVSTSPAEVYKAYFKQFQEGFKSFLKSRSEELVPGGAMVLVLPCTCKNETLSKSLWEVISLTLNDMLSEGLIEEAKLDSFNIPTYEPTIEEIRHLIKEEESLFLQRLEVFTVPRDEGVSECGDDVFLDGNIRAEFIATYTRAAMEPLLSAKFEAQVIDELFIRFQKKLVQIMKVEKFETANLMISLTKIA